MGLRRFRAAVGCGELVRGVSPCALARSQGPLHGLLSLPWSEMMSEMSEMIGWWVRGCVCYRVRVEAGRARLKIRPDAQGPANSNSHLG